MAYTVTEIDKYLTSKKYPFFKLITKEWGKDHKEDVNEIKSLWNDAQGAVSTNDKIEKFEKLNSKLSPMFNKWKDRISIMDKHLAKYNAENFSDANNQHEYDFGKQFLAYSDMPSAENEKLQNLKPEEAITGNYDTAQMKELASQYGYNYDDKDERAEFVKKIGELTRAKEVEKITSDPFVNFVLPVSTEYVRQNPDADVNAGALATDLAMNVAMFGPGKLAAKPISNQLAGGLVKAGIRNAVDLGAAPTIKAVGNALVNDLEPSEALKQGVGEVATNMAAPFLFGRYQGNLVRRLGGKNKDMGLNAYMNKQANMTRDIEERIKNGAVWAMPEGATNKASYWRWKNGQAEQITRPEYIKAKDKLSTKDMFDYSEYQDFRRDKPAFELPGVKKFSSQKQADPMDTYREIDKRSIAGEDLYNGLTPWDLIHEGIVPQETFMNYASEKIRNPIGNYVTNMFGRSNAAGHGGSYLIQTPASLLGINPSEVKAVMEPKERMPEDDKKELELYRKQYWLHKNYPKYFTKPKLPEKFKDVNIETIFGGE